MSIAEGLGGIFEDPSLLTRENTWDQMQIYPGGAYINFFNPGGQPATWINLPTTGDSGIGSGGAGVDPWVAYAFNHGAWFPNAEHGDIVFRNTSGRILFGMSSSVDGIAVGTTPSASNPAIVSGTVYQNTTASYQRLIVPVYASTAGTAGTAAVALGTTSAPSTIATEYISGSTSSTAQKVLESCSTIPPGWYYSVTLTGADFGTVTMIQM